MSDPMQRREFLKQVGAGLLGGAVVPSLLSAAETATTRPAVGTIKDLPTRKLGRTGVPVPPLSFGSAPMGHAFFEPQPFEEVTHALLDAGVRYVDTAPGYDVAQERLGPVLAKRRKEVFLVSKSRQRNRDGILREIETSLKKLQTDHLDLCHVHNLGDFTFEEVTGKSGMLEGLEEARKRGLIRFIGCSGHLLPGRWVPVLETGRIDVVMMAMNIADHHTYAFQDKVLPAAQKQGCGIVCMKVYGGVVGGFSQYRHKAPGLLVADDIRQDAIDYCLSLPGVATLVVGMKSFDEVRLAIQAVRNHRPLQGARREAVLARGAKLAKEWGPHFGPVTEA